MLKGFKITKLPDAIDPNKIISNRIQEVYGSKCPVCGESRIYSFPKEKGIERELFTDHDWVQLDESSKEKHLAKRYNYSCHTCGTEWATPWFPMNLVDDDLLEKFTEKLEEAKRSDSDKEIRLVLESSEIKLI